MEPQPGDNDGNNLHGILDRSRIASKITFDVFFVIFPMELEGSELRWLNDQTLDLMHATFPSVTDFALHWVKLHHSNEGRSTQPGPTDFATALFNIFSGNDEKRNSRVSDNP